MRLGDLQDLRAELGEIAGLRIGSIRPIGRLKN
jgi:hypothetical protein